MHAQVTNPVRNAPPQSPAASIPGIQHIVWVWFENREASAITPATAPYFASFAAANVNFTNFYGVTHPSEPNYLDGFSGSNQGVTGDGYATFPASTDNLAKQLAAAGKSWRVYAQNFPGSCSDTTAFTGGVDGPGLAGQYVRKHNPAISFESVRLDAVQCANIQPLANFDPTVNFVMVVPNMTNDMHDGTTAQGDAFLQAFVPLVTASPDWAHTLLIVSFDEGSTSINGGGHIYTAAAAPWLTHADVATTYNHFSVLRTIEAVYGLPFLGSAASATTMTELLPSTSTPTPTPTPPPPTPTATATLTPTPPPPTPSPTVTPTPSPPVTTHFEVVAPPMVIQFNGFNFTVRALDQSNNTATNYAGIVHFTSTSTGFLPPDSTLTNGTGTFSADLQTLGNHTITATDTLNASITGTSNHILVLSDQPTPPPPTPTPTLTPPSTPTPTSTPLPTTPTPTPTLTPPSTPTPTSTPLPTPSPTSTSTPALTPTPTPSPAQALNISTRMLVETGNNVLIGGFIVSGNAPKTVVVRGLGPSLTSLPFPGVLPDPTLELRNGNGLLITPNDDWQDDSAQAAQLTALGLAPSHPKEAALVATLQPDAYTAILAGKNQGIGVGLVEVYDASGGTASQLANISTRGFVRTGDNVMIGGFILGGSATNTQIVLRGIGPSLAQFGLSPALADPTLELHDSNGTTLISNDDWQSDPVSAAELTAAGFALSDPKESGIFTSLPAGQFTAILAGRNGGSGIGLIEIYNLR
ncbi:MAG: alkaline phosphatase family protein [Chthoniobacterales bacterium]